MPNRYICNVLKDMRKAYKTRNFSYLPGLIEEAQSMANRMESALGDIKDIKRLDEQRHELKKEVEQLKLIKQEILKHVGAEKKHIQLSDWRDSSPLVDIIKNILDETDEEEN